MRFVFYHIGNYGKSIREVLKTHVDQKEEVFCSITEGEELILFEKGSEYLFFYLISRPKELNHIRSLIKKNELDAKIVALCEDFQEGIKAVGNGSDYALQLPLDGSRVIRCYRHFLAM